MSAPRDCRANNLPGHELLAAADRVCAKYRELGTEIERFQLLVSGANLRRIDPVVVAHTAAVVPPGAEWVSAREAAEIACRGIDCIHVWRKDGKIRAQKRAGRWEFELQSLRAHIRT